MEEEEWEVQDENEFKKEESKNRRGDVSEGKGNGEE